MERSALDSGRLPAPSASSLPEHIRPQLARLAHQPPEDDGWLHEIKYDGYRLHARIDRDRVALLTRTGADWARRFPAICEALQLLQLERAYLDGELCAVREDGLTSFNGLQDAIARARTGDLVLYLFDLLHIGGRSLMQQPLLERKRLLGHILSGQAVPLLFSEHQRGDGPAFYRQACAMGLEGIISKRADAPYRPGDRSFWIKVKCLGRQEFIVIGWLEPAGARRHIGSLLLGYYTRSGNLAYAGRVSTGISQAMLAELARRLQPLATARTPLAAVPAGLAAAAIHWVAPELVVEIAFRGWPPAGLLRQTVFQGIREDKLAIKVRRR